MTSCDNITIWFQLLLNNFFRSCSLSLLRCLSHIFQHATSWAAFVLFSQAKPKRKTSKKKQQIFWIFWLNSHSVVMFDKFYVLGKNAAATIVAHLCGRNCFRISLSGIVYFWLSSIDILVNGKKGLIPTIVMNAGVKLIIFMPLRVGAEEFRCDLIYFKFLIMGHKSKISLAKNPTNWFHIIITGVNDKVN